MELNVPIQNQRGTMAKWKSTNPVLKAGQIGIEKDTGRFKIGDGATAWNSLKYANAPIVEMSRVPAATDDAYEVGQVWKNTTGTKKFYVLESVAAGAAVWKQVLTTDDLPQSYTHPTDDGNMHVPATGTTNSGKVLKAGSTAGSAAWGALAKSDVGLGNVSNTADADKPVSTAQQTALNAKENLIKDTTAKTSLADADTMPLSDSAASNTTKKITFANIKTVLKTYFDTLYNKYTHPTDDGSLHVPATGTANNGKVLKAGASAGSLAWGTLGKSDVGLGNADNTSDANKPVSIATQAALDIVEAIAKGKSRAKVFATVAELDAWLAVAANKAELQIGDNFFIIARDVPDYWWDGTQKQVLETEKVDLSEYPKTSAVQALIDAHAANTTLHITAAERTAWTAKEPAVSTDAVTKFYSGTKTWRDLATDVRAVVLTGLSTATNAAIAATDTILAALGKLQAQINAKANTNNTALTGTPTAPTAAADTNTTQIATTAYVVGTLQNLVIDGGDIG